jgi:dTDP-6-deoxy-L-talose 4-dehydrogenase (NAD+)
MAAASRLILLTGATGFVGRQLLRALGERGCRVRPVVRSGKQETLAPSSAIETIVTSSDIFAESADWWAQVCFGTDTVIHAAWYAEPGRYLQSPKNEECLSGTLRLAEGAAQSKVRRVVGIGTCFEYDLDAGRLSIETPLKPSTPYAQAKVDTFNALSASLHRQGIAFAWCRLFYLCGEGEDGRRLVPFVRARLQAGEPVELSSGTQIRDYLDVYEAAQMVADVALGQQEGPVNICSGRPVTVREVAERIADEFGRRDLLRFGVRPDNPVDPPYVVGIRS